MKNFRQYILEFDEKGNMGDKTPKQSAANFLYDMIELHRSMMGNNKIAQSLPENLTDEIRTAIWKTHLFTVGGEESQYPKEKDLAIETIRTKAPHLFPKITKALRIEPIEAEGKKNTEKQKEFSDEGGLWTSYDSKSRSTPRKRPGDYY